MPTKRTPCFGEFNYAKCKSKWKSSRSYENADQKCKNCKTMVTATNQRPLKEAKKVYRANDEVHLKGEGPFFGEFNCRKCQKRWLSAFCWFETDKRTKIPQKCKIARKMPHQCIRSQNGCVAFIGTEKQCSNGFTVWRLGFLWKFYKIIPSKKIGRLVNAMLTNRTFRVFINDKSSRPRRLNNRFAQGSVCAPPYFNLYTSDMPVTFSRKFGYADDLGMTIQILQRDIERMKRYYVQWRLKLNDQKTEVGIFHLNNQQAGRQLEVFVDGVRLKHNHVPCYLGIPLDRSLTYREHLENLSQKVRTRNNLIQKLSGTNWGATGNVLRTAVLSLVYSCAEYCAPAWYRSCHVDKLDVQLNSAMRTITGTVDSTPIPWLHVLANIAPPALRRKMAAQKEWTKCVDDSREYELPIKNDLANPPPRRLTSRSPIWTDSDITGESFEIAAAWKSYWNGNPYFTNKHLIDFPEQKLEGFDLQRREWKMLNRFRSGHGCCNEQMHRWNFVESPLCDCDNGVNQSLNHILNYCPNRRFEHGLETLHQGCPEGIEWLQKLDIEI